MASIMPNVLGMAHTPRRAVTGELIHLQRQNKKRVGNRVGSFDDLRGGKL